MAIPSVKFNGQDMYEKFGVFLQHSDIEAPSVKTKFIDVPLRDGRIDATEILTGRVNYNDRVVTTKFKYIGKYFKVVYDEILNFLHGMEAEIIFSDDDQFYYSGRVTSISPNEFTNGGTIEIKTTCEPFKTDLHDASEVWEWDPLDFETAIINDFSNWFPGMPRPIQQPYYIMPYGLDISLIAAGKPSLLYLDSVRKIKVTWKGETVTIAGNADQSVKVPVYFSKPFDRGENIIHIELDDESELNPFVYAYYRGGRL